MRVVVNKYKDFIERVGWTAAEAGAGAFLSWIETGDPWSWHTFFYAIGIAACKVILAQRSGDHGNGDAIPGGVIETKPSP